MDSLSYIPTFHAVERMAQRGIRRDTLDIILTYGETRRSGPDWLVVLTDNVLEGTPFATIADRLCGLAAVLTRDGVLKSVQRLYHVRRRHKGARRPKAA